MEFDRLTIALLILRSDAPQLDEEEAAAPQDAHLTHLADLHEAGHLLAAGPIASEDPNEELRGLSILNVEPERAQALTEADPAVRAGTVLHQDPALDGSRRGDGVLAHPLPPLGSRSYGRLI